jgi:hypothetical protein
MRELVPKGLRQKKKTKKEKKRQKVWPTKDTWKSV